MANVHHYKAGEGSLWVQRNGPNTAPVYLGCHLVGDIDIPRGDITLIRCRDKSGPNKFRVVGSTQEAAGAITTTITADFTEDIDELERANCAFTLFIQMAKEGARDLFSNFERSVALVNTRVTSQGYSSLVARSDDDQGRSEETYDVSAEFHLSLKEPTISRQTTSETEAINDITFCNDASCRTSEDIGQDACEVGFAVADAATGVAANVLYTNNGGTTWTAAAADPFDADEHVIAVECFDVDAETTRVLVARGSTDALAPLEIAYSDDNGTTWTSVEVGSVNGQFAPTRHSLWAVDRSNIWVTSDDGYIYYSSNGGLTWTAQESGAINAAEWNAIHFADEDIGWVGGAANEIARTLNGGDSWNAITGPSAKSGDDITAIFTVDRNRAWVGYNDGELWFTMDGGTTWEQRDFVGSGVGQVRDIKFLNELLGFMAVNNATPVGRLLWTIDGGFSWSRLDLDTNTGYNALFICDQWNLFVVGEAESSLGYIAKASV